MYLHSTLYITTVMHNYILLWCLIMSYLIQHKFWLHNAVCTHAHCTCIARVHIVCAYELSTSNYRYYHTHRISEVKCSLDEIVDLVNWRKVHQMLHAYSIVTLDYCGGTERGRRRERERERERERKGEWVRGNIFEFLELELSTHRLPWCAWA